MDTKFTTLLPTAAPAPLYPYQYARSEIPRMIEVLQQAKKQIRHWSNDRPRICYAIGCEFRIYMCLRQMIMYSLNGSGTLDAWLGKPLSKREGIRLRIQWINKMIEDLQRYQCE